MELLIDDDRPVGAAYPPPRDWKEDDSEVACTADGNGRSSAAAVDGGCDVNETK